MTQSQVAWFFSWWSLTPRPYRNHASTNGAHAMPQAPCVRYPAPGPGLAGRSLERHSAPRSQFGRRGMSFPPTHVGGSRGRAASLPPHASLIGEVLRGPEIRAGCRRGQAFREPFSVLHDRRDMTIPPRGWLEVANGLQDGAGRSGVSTVSPLPPEPRIVHRVGSMPRLYGP